ncbi:MAG: hypothetical protein ACR2O6_04290 [Ilumatobacteraceae bacterium]
MDSVDPRPPRDPQSGTPGLAPPVVAESPEFAPEPTSETPGHQQGEIDLPRKLPMAVFRLLAAVSFAGAFCLSGVQVLRVLEDQERSMSLGFVSVLVAIVCVAAVLMWTWMAVENARRIVSPAETYPLPDPTRAVLLWAVPISFVVPAIAVVAVLSQRWDSPLEGTSSSAPLLVAFGALLISLLLLSAPVSYMTKVLRSVGGGSVTMLRWMWVPVVFAVVGAAAIGGLRAFGTFEDNTDGIAPSWVVAVLLMLPLFVVFFVGFSAASNGEETISRAFDRRLGRTPSVDGRSSVWLSIYGGEGPNRVVLSTKGPTKLLPAGNLLRLVMVTLLAGIALLSVVGALVMFLFWRETSDGLVLPSQRTRAWEVLDQLQVAESYIATALLVAVMAWTVVTVFNVRLASGRRRNPIIAMVSWPAAVAGIWAVADRVGDASEPEVVVLGFIVQAALLYVPFFLLERSAVAIGTRRSPFRIVYAVGVVMLVHIQGLGGLSTIDQVSDVDQFGRLAAYLALGALVQLLSTLAVTEASLTISDAYEHEAEQHNFLIAQRQPSATAAPAVPAVPAG